MTKEESDLPKLASPAKRALDEAGINRLDQLTKVSEAELSKLHGMGPNAIGKLRQALQLEGLSFAESHEVNEFMNALDHPLKVEVQIVREIIKNVNKKINEEIKWNAPSFRYKDYIATFNLHTKTRVHLVFHHPQIAQIKSNILEGDYKDRRMVYFTDMQDINVKKAELEKIVKELIALMET